MYKGRSWRDLVVILRRANRDRPNVLNRKASASEKVDGTTNTNSDADRPKGRKRRMSDRENGVTWTSKKTKVSVPMKMINSLTVHILYRRERNSVSSFILGKKGQQWRYVWRSPSYRPSVDKQKWEKYVKLTKLLPSHNSVRIVDKKIYLQSNRKKRAGIVRLVIRRKEAVRDLSCTSEIVEKLLTVITCSYFL